MRIAKSKYKASKRGIKLRKRARKKRKGLADKHKEKEGPMYVPGGFDGSEPGPSKRVRTS